jgi:molybdate transport system substrate-binding protein
MCDHRDRSGGIMTAATGIRILTMLVLTATARPAAAAEIRVYCSGAPAEAAKIIAADFGRDTGDHLTFIVAQPAVIQGDLAAGDKADVVILPSPVVAMLTGTGVLRANSAVDIAQVGIGVVVRAGAARPDISSVAAFRKLLLDAHAIVYPDPSEIGGGSTGRAIARLIDKLGLTETVRPKLTVKPAIGGGVDLVAAGKADIGIFNISEIVPVKGVTLVGPLPAELQSNIVFSAAIPNSNAAPGPAAAFIKRLADPAARRVWQNAGLEPLGAAR